METQPSTTPDSGHAPTLPGTASASFESGVHGITLTPLGLVSTRSDLSPDEFSTLFRAALTINRAGNWILGDTLNIAERRWGNQITGSKYAEAANFTGLSVSTIRHITYTCLAIPYDRRRADLSFSHHIEACSRSLDPKVQDIALELAAKKGMSIRAMRKAMRDALPGEPDDWAQQELSAGAENDDRPFGQLSMPKPPKPGAPPLWDAMNFVDWAKEEDPYGYDCAQCEQAFKLIEPLIDYIAELKARMDELEIPHTSQDD